MRLKDRVRGMRTDAVATKLPSARTSLEQAHHHRRRLLVIAALTLTLVLGVAVIVAEDRGRSSRSAASPTTLALSGSMQFRDPSRNLRFSYPPEWMVKPHPESSELLLLIPPEFAQHPLKDKLPFVVAIQMDRGYYIGKVHAELTKGRLRGGQSYVRLIETPATISPPEVQPPIRRWYDTYYVDWGRFCARFPPDPQGNCGAHSVTVTIAAGTAALFERYRQVASAIVQTMAHVRATKPSFGDRTRPACHPSQWRLVPEYGWSYIPGSRSWLIQGTALPQGRVPACHLKATLKISVVRSGSTPVLGTPAPLTIEGDLPEDTSGIRPSDSLAPPTPLTWHWTWQNWCRQPLGDARIRITAPDGKSATKQPPPLQNYLEMGGNPCEGVSPTAPWRISQWP